MNTKTTLENGIMNEKLHGNAKKTNNSNSLIERVEIDGTPFTAIRNEEEWFLTMGKYRLTQAMKTLEEVKNDATNTDWFRIMQIIGIMIEEYNEKK